MSIKQIIKDFIFALIITIFTFSLFYIMAAFTAWEIDCREWDELGRYAVVFLTTVISGLIIFHKYRK